MAMLLTERWPEDRAGNRPAPAEEGADGQAQELLGEMAALLRDTRPGTLTSGAALGAITIGLAVEAAARPGPRPGPAVAVCAGLFAILALCWLRAVTLLVLSGLPLGRALAQHRVHTGAPLDPRAPWASIPPPAPRPGGRAGRALICCSARPGSGTSGSSRRGVLPRGHGVRPGRTGDARVRTGRRGDRLPDGHDLRRRPGPLGDRRARPVLALPLSQQELASLASTSRATVTRALSDWRRRRLLRTGAQDHDTDRTVRRRAPQRRHAVIGGVMPRRPAAS